MDLKEANFVILINHASTPIRKERLHPTTETRREASRNGFVEKGGVPDRVQSFVVDVVITPPIPRDGGTTQTAIQVHAINLIEIRLGVRCQSISNQS